MARSLAKDDDYYTLRNSFPVMRQVRRPASTQPANQQELWPTNVALRCCSRYVCGWQCERARGSRSLVFVCVCVCAWCACNDHYIAFTYIHETRVWPEYTIKWPSIHSPQNLCFHTYKQKYRDVPLNQQEQQQQQRMMRHERYDGSEWRAQRTHPKRNKKNCMLILSE